MKRSAIVCVLAWLIPASAWAQTAQPGTPSRLWIVAGAGSGTLRGHCQDCGADFPFRHGGALVGNAGVRVTPRIDVGADLYWIQWRNDSGELQGTAINAVAQLRPWESKVFFIKGGAGMAFVRNWVPTTGPDPDQQKALSVVFGGGWAFNPNGRLGLQVFATQHVGALGDLDTVNGPIADVTGNFWSLGAAIVIR